MPVRLHPRRRIVPVITKGRDGLVAFTDRPGIVNNQFLAHTRRWLDRLWLTAIALSAIFIGVLWFLLSVERMGLRTVVAFIALALVAHFHSPGPTPE